MHTMTSDEQDVVRKFIDAFTASVGRVPAGIPVWEYRAHASGRAAEPLPGLGLVLSAGLWLKLLAEAPICLRFIDGDEDKTSVVKWARRFGLSIEEAIDAFSDARRMGKVSWDADDEVHFFKDLLHFVPKRPGESRS